MIQRTVRLNIRMMGTPEIYVGETPLILNHLKSRALLFYLAATGRPHTREHLAALLWGESGQSEASHSLRSSLYHLRKSLSANQIEEVLISDGELLRFDPASYECDRIEIRRLLSQRDEQALAKAVTLRRGPLLQGFTLTDAPLFDDWVQVEDSNLNHVCFEALESLASWAESREAWRDAINYVQQMIQVDSLAEAAQQ